MRWKQDQTPLGKSLNLIAPDPVARGICSKIQFVADLVCSTSAGLLIVVASMVFSLGYLCSLLIVFLRQFMFLTSPYFWVLHCTFIFSLAASHTVLSEEHCLVSQASFWNLSGSPSGCHNPCILHAHAYKTSATWMTPRSTAIWRSSENFFSSFQ